MNYNLFIIRSPLQIINAYEAIDYFDLKNNILVTIDTKGLSNAEQISYLKSNDIKWEKEIRFGNTDQKSKSNFLQYIKLIKSLKEYKYDNIFIGDYGSIHKIILANLKSKNQYLLDDGTTTLLRHLQFKTDKTKSKFSLRTFRFKLFGLKTNTKQLLNYFSIFKLNPNFSEKVIMNNFDKLKTIHNIDSFTKDNCIYIMGQPLVETGYIKRDVYLDFITNIIKKYKNQKVVYLAHRSETLESIEEYENDFFTILKSSKPIELMFLEEKKYPEQIIGFTSAALFTFKILFPKSSILSIEITKEQFVQNYYIMELIYSHMKSQDIEFLTV